MCCHAAMPRAKSVAAFSPPYGCQFPENVSTPQTAKWSYKMTHAKLRLAMGQQGTVVNELCKELGVTRQTLYRHIGPDGMLRQDGQKLLAR